MCIGECADDGGRREMGSVTQGGRREEREENKRKIEGKKEEG